MMENTEKRSQSLPNPPRGLRKIPWRLPIWFYRFRLGWIFGHRALLLTHIGRVSGSPRVAMLEVIHYDLENNVHYVASGFGEKSDWFKNILKNPAVTIKSTGKEFPAAARVLEPDDAESIFRGYIKKHPNAIKNLAKLVGYKIGDSEADTMEFLRMIPVIAFFPKQ